MQFREPCNSGVKYQKYRNRNNSLNDMELPGATFTDGQK